MRHYIFFIGLSGLGPYFLFVKILFDPRGKNSYTVNTKRGFLSEFLDLPSLLTYLLRETEKYKKCLINFSENFQKILA